MISIPGRDADDALRDSAAICVPGARTENPSARRAVPAEEVALKVLANALDSAAACSTRLRMENSVSLLGFACRFAAMRYNGLGKKVLGGRCAAVACGSYCFVAAAPRRRRHGSAADFSCFPAIFVSLGSTRQSLPNLFKLPLAPDGLQLSSRASYCTINLAIVF